MARLQRPVLMQLDPETGEAMPDELKGRHSSNAWAVTPTGAAASRGRRMARSSPGPTPTVWEWWISRRATLRRCCRFREYAPLLERSSSVWIPTLSWSDDGHLVTTVHGAPYADEAPEDSIDFDMAVADVDSDLQINPFIPQTGIWSIPTYSPLVAGADGNPTYSDRLF